METLLFEKGYDVRCFKSSEDALDDLKKAESPCAVIISSYMMPKMKGDEILQNARKLSPDTQRVLLADTSDLKAIVNAVNKAEINACVTLPFEDEDFLIQVINCCDQYEKSSKKIGFLKVSKRQNLQLFKSAKNFKKGEQLNASTLEKKEKEIRLLESRIRSAGGATQLEKPVLLQDVFRAQNTLFSKGSCRENFLSFADQIKRVLEQAASGHAVKLDSFSYPDALKAVSEKNRDHEMVAQMMPLIYSHLEKKAVSDVKPSEDIHEINMDEYFELTLTKDKIKAFIKVKKEDTGILSTAHVKQLLEKKGVVTGVASDDAIESWLQNTSSHDNPFMIACGKKPRYPRDAKVKYHFPTDFLHAGKVNDDGSMNFQDRGEIPYVKEGAFLAGKIAVEEGKNGMNVMGHEILVDDPIDQTFSLGSGTRMSDDGVRIYAETSGQPYLDAMGNISVCPEYKLQGDIGLETGDVVFDGNVVVNGSVKQGFKVRCASLTAKEIQGAHVDIEGDLNVSMGIVDTELVKVKGSVQAKFVHNSKINAFGDLIVQKEIIDSTINLSGACINKTGSILNCTISAKMGVDAGRVGNKSSKSSKLTVGVDEHINHLIAAVDFKFNKNKNAADELKSEIEKFEKEDQNLHAVIATHAHIQDRSQLQLKDIEKKIKNLKASGNMAALQKVVATVKEIKKSSAEAEEKINEGFERQDEIAMEISQKKGRIKELEDLNRELSDRKKRLEEFSNRNQPIPEVKVAKNIEAGTKIFSSNASLIIHNSSSRCRIREFSQSQDGTGDMEYFEMKITDY